MVLLTFLLNSNDETIWLDEPIKNFEFIRLSSCSYYSSWHNLKKRGEITVIDDKDVRAVNKIYPGYYNLDAIGKKIKNILEKENIKVILGDERGSIVIVNPGKKVIFDRELSYLLGLSQNDQRHTLKKGDTIINRLFSFNNMLISCDLVDKNKNFYNGKPSTVLGCFEIGGLPYERHLLYSINNPFRKIAGGKKVINSLRITLTEENGEVIDFNGLPLRIDIEII